MKEIQQQMRDRLSDIYISSYINTKYKKYKLDHFYVTHLTLYDISFMKYSILLKRIIKDLKKGNDVAKYKNILKDIKNQKEQEDNRVVVENIKMTTVEEEWALSCSKLNDLADDLMSNKISIDAAQATINSVDAKTRFTLAYLKNKQDDFNKEQKLLANKNIEGSYMIEE